VFIGGDSAAYAELINQQDILGIRVSRFRKAEDFLDAIPLGASGCVLTEIDLAGMGGFELHAALVERRASLPVIFLAAQGNVSMAVRAMQAGAFDFLQEPIDSAALLRCVHAALVYEERQYLAAEKQRALDLKYGRLTPRERDVLKLVTSGCSNKQAGQYLSISYRTVEVYRGRLMQKLELTTLLELAAFAGVRSLQSG
jgi:FixJ family two-component response regulator